RHGTRCNPLVAPPEQLFLRVGVFDDRLDHQCRRNEVVDDGDASEHLVRRCPTFAFELRQALSHCVEGALGGSGLRVVERNVPARSCDDLRDAPTHLPRADHEHVLECHARSIYTSRSSASPCPPPEQMAASPRPPPLRRSPEIIVPRIRSPDAPIGWPSATAPPFTFTFSGSASSILAELSTTEENASFNSTRSTPSIFFRAFP